MKKLLNFRYEKYRWVAFFEEYIKEMLPDLDAVKLWQKRFLEFLSDESYLPLYVRFFRKNEYLRGKTTHISQGSITVRFADNAPAWFVMTHSFGGGNISDSDWLRCRKSLPCEYFAVLRQLGNQCPNLLGWYVAHIFPLSDRTRPENWDDNNVKRRFIKFLHPLNMFPFPCPPNAPKIIKSRLRREAENHDVTSFIARQYKEMFPDLWDEFLEMIERDETTTCYVADWEIDLRAHSLQTAPLLSMSATSDQGQETKEDIEELQGDGEIIDVMSNRDKFEEWENQQLTQNDPTLPLEIDGRRITCYGARRLHFKRPYIDRLLSQKDIMR